jgi:hypothetical protein
MKNNPFSATSFFKCHFVSPPKIFLLGRKTGSLGRQSDKTEEDTEILQTKENLFNDIRNGPNMPLPQTR